jgi:AbrB family looped-hinge helix DNA binding protein
MARKSAMRYTSKVDNAGRVVIPARIREKFGVKPGDAVTITAGPSGRITVEPRLAVLKEAQDYFRGLAPESELWSEELIAERRREARREAED